MASVYTRWVGIVLLLVLASPPLYGNDTSTQPPEPSYSDQWASIEEGSSPLLDLRNEEPEVSPPKSPEVDTGNMEGGTVPVPDRADTKTAGDSPSSSDTRNKVLQQTEDTHQQKSSQKKNDTTSDTIDASSASPSLGADTSSEEMSDTGDEDLESDTDDGTVPGEKSEPEPVSQRKIAGSALNDTSSSELRSDTVGPQQDQPNYTDRTEMFFESASPKDPGGIRQSTEVIGGTLPRVPGVFGTTRVDTILAGGVKNPTRDLPFWWQYYGWIAGGLVVFVMIGMFFWFRRRQVKVIDGDDRPAGDFFQEQFKRRKPSSLGGDTDRGEDSISSPVEPIAPSQSTPAETEYEILVKKMREEGFNGRFEKLIKLYYEEGMTEEKIAERTSRGLGEVGLIIDYADRLRKDIDHGKRA